MENSEYVKKEYLYDLYTIRSKCEEAIEEGDAVMSAERLMLHEIAGYCKGCIRRVNDFY